MPHCQSNCTEFFLDFSHLILVIFSPGCRNMELLTYSVKSSSGLNFGFHPFISSCVVPHPGWTFYSPERHPHSRRVQALWVELPHVQMFSSCLGTIIFTRLKTPHVLCRCLLVFEASSDFQFFPIAFYFTSDLRDRR